jgi:methylated-DNA-[protein]-cysteine S-methyltransferase
MPMPADKLLVFRTALGWMAVVVCGRTVKRLTFGHGSAAEAAAAIEPDAARRPARGKTAHPLVRRLKAFAQGEADDFLDVSVDYGPVGDFQRRVLDRCRRIPPGKTLSYAELAVRAGSPRAARAVGNCMAKNRVPLIVPCHRVIGSAGQFGRYSAPGGAAMKRRLLDLESPHDGLES